MKRAASFGLCHKTFPQATCYFDRIMLIYSLMKNFLGKLVYFCLIAAYVLASGGGVLCYGSDGHVAVEIAFHDHCHGHSHSHEHDEETEHEHHESEHDIEFCSDCQPCTDVPLSSDYFGASSVKNLVQIFKPALNNVAVINDGDSLIITDFSPSAYSAFFSPLKTIVLLT